MDSAFSAERMMCEHDHFMHVLKSRCHRFLNYWIVHHHCLPLTLPVPPWCLARSSLPQVATVSDVSAEGPVTLMGPSVPL